MTQLVERSRPGRRYNIKKLLGGGSEGVAILRIANSVLIVSVIIALISLTVLYDRNRKLRQETVQLRSNLRTISGTIAGSPSAEVGDLLPSFETQSLDGTKSSILYNGKSKYLLYIFSPECGVCMAEFPTWNRIALQAQARKYRVVGLQIYSDAGPEEKQEPLDRKFEILRIPSVAIQRAYRVLTVPMVMLVSEDGKLQWVRYGKLPKDSENQLLSLIEQQ